MRRPAIPWRSFRARFDWRQGEHVSLIGPTRCGKTTLAKTLLPMRGYRAVLGTKPEDPLYDEFVARGYRRMQRWSPRGGDRKVILWPKIKRWDDDLDTWHAEIFREALRSMYLEKGWTIFIDEARYVCHMLKLNRELQRLWQQGRTQKISVMATTQRPSHMPLEMYDQADHLFFWRDNDRVNLTRIGGLGGSVDSDEVRRTVRNLDEHEFAYLNTRTGELVVSQVDLDDLGGRA